MNLSPKLFYIQLIVTDEFWAPGLVITKDGLDLQKEFAHYVADRYREELQRAINNQRFRQKWPPLSLSYLRHKQREGLSIKTWEATGRLKKSVSVIPTNWGWAVGPNPRQRYPRTGIPVLAVARALEYGTDKIPPRPLFRPTAEYIRKHIRDYWEKFLLLKKINLEEPKQPKPVRGVPGKKPQIPEKPI